jgi:hypothetical protein
MRRCGVGPGRPCNGAFRETLERVAGGGVLPNGKEWPQWQRP